MSGILLPGQENKPASDIKIELPGGFSSRKRGDETPPAEKPAETPATPPATDEGSPAEEPAAEAPAAKGRRGGGRGQPAFDLLFPPAPVQIRCPNCGTPYQVALFSIIDLGVNPELKGPLLSGQINVAACPNCGVGGPLSAPLLVHEPAHNFLGVFAPMQAQNMDAQ
ncbi:MAG TPA: CpXC domain-containing protein, partial [Caldilineaceae bacterium]|nr:CpXC domain-containing protein [Caldilineaceae bacterium]